MLYNNKSIFKSKLFDHKIWIVCEDDNVIWKKVASNIKIIVKDVLGESKGKTSNSKNSWWWNQNVQKKIKNKKLCYKN